jgi:arylsulfatase A-like enzyme
VRWPAKIKAGTCCDTPVIGIDFYPTFLAAANVSKPKGKILDGQSLLPLLTQTGKLPKRALYWHFPIYLQVTSKKYSKEFHDPYFRTRPGSVIIYGKWKLHEYFEDGNLELYSLGTDIGEQHNLAGQMPEKTRELHAMLKSWRNEVHAPVPTRLNPGYNP